jgi:hypothetical protein
LALNSAVNRLRVLMVDRPLRHQIHLSRLSQKPEPPLNARLNVRVSFRLPSLLLLTHPSQILWGQTFIARLDNTVRCSWLLRHNALKSSGKLPNFRKTVASLKSPVAGSPVRLKAIAPVWPNIFQRPCARPIAAAGLGHSIGSPTTTLPSATSNGNATKYVIPSLRLNHTSPSGRAAEAQTCRAHSNSRRRLVTLSFTWASRNSFATISAVTACRGLPPHAAMVWSVAAVADQAANHSINRIQIGSP